MQKTAALARACPFDLAECAEYKQDEAKYLTKRSWHWLRDLVAVVLAAFIMIGPAYRQVFHGRQAAMPSWTMFSGMAVNFLAIDVGYRESGSAEVSPLSEEMLFPRPRPGLWDEQPQRRTAIRLSKKRDLERVIQSACRQMPSGTTLMVDARRADRAAGWKTLYRAEEFPCDEPRRRKGKRKGKNRSPRRH